MMMILKTLLLVGIVAAVPAQLEERTPQVNCKGVDLVVKALSIAPGASKYCSTVLQYPLSPQPPRLPLPALLALQPPIP